MEDIKQLLRNYGYREDAAGAFILKRDESVHTIVFLPEFVEYNHVKEGEDGKLLRISNNYSETVTINLLAEAGAIDPWTAMGIDIEKSLGII